jgi:hypothetical protein
MCTIKSSEPRSVSIHTINEASDVRVREHFVAQNATHLTDPSRRSSAFHANGTLKPLVRKSLQSNFRIRITSTNHPPRHGLQKRILHDYADRVDKMQEELTNEIMRDIEEVLVDNKEFFVSLTVESPMGDELTYGISEPDSPSSENYYI